MPMAELNKMVKGISCLAVLIGAGCAAPIQMYEGKARPVAEVARVTNSTSLTYPLFLLKVDGKYGQGPHFAFNNNQQNYDVHLLPGKHTLEFCSRKISPVELTFQAEPGKEYVAKDDGTKVHLLESGKEVPVSEEKLQAYADPQREDAATLEGKGISSWGGKEFGITLHRVDGKYGAGDVLTGTFSDNGAGTYSVKLVPGEHEVDFSSIGRSGFLNPDAYSGAVAHREKIRVEARKRYTFKVEKVAETSDEKLGKAVIVNWSLVEVP